MLTLGTGARIFVARDRVDFRKGLDGLCGLVREHLREEPVSGHWYLFFNRHRNRIKILVWDRNGFWLLCKRLERGVFERVDGSACKVEIDRAQLAMLLDGVQIKMTKYSRHFVRDVRILSRAQYEQHRAAGGR